jgi:nucleotidyltransferase DUF2204
MEWPIRRGDDERHPYDPPKRRIDKHPFLAYAHAISALDDTGVPHLIGGGVALSHYGRSRPTKDLDIFIRRQDAETVMNILNSVGFTTLETNLPWLRKAQMTNVFIDLILWANGPLDLALEEVERGRVVVVEKVPMRIFAPEDLLVRKIYLMREGSPDWEDALSILGRMGSEIRWDMLERPNLDRRLLMAFLLAADAQLPGVLPPGLLTGHLERLLEGDVEPRALPATTEPALAQA